MSEMNHKKKIAILTGATGGIGQIFIKQLLNEDLDEIWAIGRSEVKLEKLKQQYREKIVAISADLSQEKDFEIIKQKLVQDNVVIHFLINNAGLGKMGRYDEFSVEELMAIIDVNCKAMVWMCQECIPYMEKGSRILNISSAAAFQPNPYLNIYSATKVFVRYYSRALNMELQDNGIVCTAVCPGWVDTEMLEKERNGKKIHFPGIVSPERVVKQALENSRKGKDMSVCSGYVKMQHVYSKLMPQQLVMKQWIRGIKKYIV